MPSHRVSHRLRARPSVASLAPRLSSRPATNIAYSLARGCGSGTVDEVEMKNAERIASEARASREARKGGLQRRAYWRAAAFSRVMLQAVANFAGRGRAGARPGSAASSPSLVSSARRHAAVVVLRSQRPAYCARNRPTSPAKCSGEAFETRNDKGPAAVRWLATGRDFRHDRDPSHGRNRSAKKTKSNKPQKADKLGGADRAGFAARCDGARFRRTVARPGARFTSIQGSCVAIYWRDRERGGPCATQPRAAIALRRPRVIRGGGQRGVADSNDATSRRFARKSQN